MGTVLGYYKTTNTIFNFSYLLLSRIFAIIYMKIYSYLLGRVGKKKVSTSPEVIVYCNSVVIIVCTQLRIKSLTFAKKGDKLMYPMDYFEDTPGIKRSVVL